MIDKLTALSDGTAVAKLTGQSKLVEYRRGDTITDPNTPETPIILVSSGVLAIKRHNPFAESEILTAPTFRGAAVNIVGGLRNSTKLTITALSRCNVYRLEQPAIRELKSDPQFLEWCTTQMAFNMESLFQYIIALRTASIDDRVVQFLISAYWEINRRMPDGAFNLSWPLTQNDLAMLIGVSRPYLNASLKRLEKSGKVQFREEQIQVSP